VPEVGLPPHDISAEEAVLAACLLDGGAVARCRVIVQPEDFFREQNGWIYQSCLDLDSRGEEVTIPTVAHEMLRSGKLDEAGGEPYLVEVIASHMTAVGVETHAKIVSRDAMYRRLISTASKIAEKAWEGGPDPVSVVAEGMGLLLAVRTAYDEDAPTSMGGHDVYKDDDGVKTGVPVIDRYMLGLSAGKLTTLAGPSGQGKSLLAGQIAINVAESKGSVLIVSMEMSGKEYEERMVRSVALLDHRPVSEDDWEMVHTAQSHISELPIKFWNKPRVTLDQIRARATAIKADHGLDLLVIDYLQLMMLPPGRDSEAAKYGVITSSLKQLATELNCHVLLLSQMNRGAAGEMRGKDAYTRECLITNSKYPIPFIESLKGSGSIEQDSDHVLFIAPHKECAGNLKHVSIILAKNRHGEQGESLMRENFDMAAFRQFTSEECFKIAGANLWLAQHLRIDQGYDTEDDYDNRPIRPGQ
jgi:replicative DNA helicase